MENLMSRSGNNGLEDINEMSNDSNIIEILKDKLSLIAYCTTIGVGRFTGLEHAMQWREKSRWAREALEAIQGNIAKNVELHSIIERLKEDLELIAELPYSQKLDDENLRLNHALVWYKQVEIGRGAYKKLLKHLETVV